MELNIDGKQVEQYIANAVLESALGEIIRTAIEDELKHTKAIEDGAKELVRQIIWELVRDGYKDQIEAIVRERLTDEVVGQAASAALNVWTRHIENDKYR